MNKEEAIKYLQQLYPNGGHCWLDEQRIEAIDMAVKALKEEPVSEDLEEASKKYSSCIYLEEVLSDDDKEVLKERLINTFKAGAQWQKQKEINEIRAEIKRRYEHHLGCMEGSRDDTYPEISHAHHCAIKTELFELLCFLDVLEGKSK